MDYNKMINIKRETNVNDKRNDYVAKDEIYH